MKMCEKCPDEKYRLSNTELCIECQKDGAVVEPNAHSVLSEVRAMKQKNNGYEEIGYGDLYVDGYNKAIDDVLEKLSEHFR